MKTHKAGAKNTSCLVTEVGHDIPHLFHVSPERASAHVGCDVEVPLDTDCVPGGPAEPAPGPVVSDVPVDQS